jgi:hypothetical protein
MPGFLLHVGAKVLCSHAGQASPVAPNPRVLVMGQPIVTMTSLYAITGCGLSPNAGGPCVSAQWVSGSLKVLSNGAPVLLLDSRSVCTPTGTPLIPTVTQTSVIGT